jgi:drug/metabolite transporter (DMT)-like permease
MPYLGEICALGTALTWSLSAVAWSHAGRRVGSQATSAVRLVLAVAIVGVIHWIVYGSPVPQGGTRHGLLLLALSGLLGVGVGDLCFFQALKLIGPRIGMLLLTVSPAITALLAYFLPPHESLSAAAIAGMALTAGGIGWVILEEPGPKAWQATPKQFRRGVLLGMLGAVLFSLGYLFSRQALAPQNGYGWAPFPATLIRMVPAMLLTVAILPLTGKLANARRACAEWGTLRILLLGTLVGPVVGIWLSMIALQRAEAGVATALINTGPLFMIPIAHFSHGEKPTWRGILGTAVAIAGVALLVLRGHAG